MKRRYDGEDGRTRLRRKNVTSIKLEFRGNLIETESASALNIKRSNRKGYD